MDAGLKMGLSLGLMVLAIVLALFQPLPQLSVSPSGAEPGPISSQPSPPSSGEDSDWKKKLTPEQYRVLREKGTEPAFAGKYVNHHGHGVYRCAGCGTVLFESKDKFDSGTGWPSFVRPSKDHPIRYIRDTSHGMVRTEVVCAKCGGHLGHVFDDGPQEKTGKRFCINSAALDFQGNGPSKPCPRTPQK